MSGDSFGKLFRISNWGESHGPAIGVNIEGCPAGLALSEDDIQPELDRRRPGQSKIVTQRKEADKVEILSGVVDGKTTGTPISLLIKNADQRSKDYSNIENLFRPGHADFSYYKKYGIRDIAGGGRSSARVTAGSVAAGAVAKKIIEALHQTRIIAYVKSIQDLSFEGDPLTVDMAAVEANPVRCPDPAMAERMRERIEAVRKQGESIGGVVECVIAPMPVGLGEPIFDKLDAELAKAMLSINASKGFELGSGFAGTKMMGSEHNDIFVPEGNATKTQSNHAGGVLGGISNGMPVIFRVAFKPTATIIKTQDTVDKDNNSVSFMAKGRHDPCVLPRAVPIVEAMAALVICDLSLRHRAARL